jgi:hypothetical protein
MRSPERVDPSGRSPASRAVALVLRLGVVTGLALTWVRTAGLALAASPGPTPGAGGDPRSSGQGPGLVGDPLLAIGLVVALAVVSLLVTLAYVRATADRHRRAGPR